MMDKFLRPAQHEIIELIDDLPARRSLAIEAPVGSGKSRAALMAAAQSGQALIASSTKALSNQYEREIKLVSEHTRARFKVLSGKRAMGCRCPAKMRQHYSACPYPDHLEEARAADVVITNHALLAVTALGYRDLGPRRTTIIDEGHEFAAPREIKEIKERTSSDEEHIHWTPDAISEALLERGSSLTFLSATLNAHHPHLADPYILRSAGIPIYRTAVLPSPFDWKTQLTLGAYTCPDGDWPTFAVGTANHLLDDRGSLFIVRSHREKHRVSQALEASGRDVLMQADPADARPDQARKVVAALNDKPGLCVVGTDILMTGLDVPGDALGNVVVCGPPMIYGQWMDTEEIASRMERVHGSDILRDYLVPNRALRLTQAIGRGVRSTTDTATVIVGIHRDPDRAIYDAAAARFN